jgi:hypothetical protein
VQDGGKGLSAGRGEGGDVGRRRDGGQAVVWASLGAWDRKLLSGRSNRGRAMHVLTLENSALQVITISDVLICKA